DAPPESRAGTGGQSLAHHATPSGRQEPFDAEPPGFMDAPPYFDGDMDGYTAGEMDYSRDEPHHFDPAPPSAYGGRQTSRNKKRPARQAGAMPKTRAVTPIAKRLLRLLLAHPQLVDRLGDQQLE